MDRDGAIVRAVVDVPAATDRAFRHFVERIGDWWHVEGPYWNDRDRRIGLRMEPGPGGRLVEVYDATTGEGFEIGRIVGWQPGRRLAFLWRQADWPEDEMTEVEVMFEPLETEAAFEPAASDPVGVPMSSSASGRPRTTRVTLVHTGWERVRSDRAADEGYQEGWGELLGWFAEDVEAAAKS